MIERIDHVVLTVKDVEATCAFYSRHLGMRVVRAEGQPTALHFGNQKFNVHPAGREFEPKSHAPTPGSADLCLIASDPVEELMERLRAGGVIIANRNSLPPIRNPATHLATLTCLIPGHTG